MKDTNQFTRSTLSSTTMPRRALLTMAQRYQLSVGKARRVLAASLVSIVVASALAPGKAVHAMYDHTLPISSTIYEPYRDVVDSERPGQGASKAARMAAYYWMMEGRHHAVPDLAQR